MKKWLTLSLALVAAAVTQAVTVAWTLPNSDYNVNEWATDANGNLKVDVYFVYSAEALNVETAYKNVTTAITGETIGKGNVAYGVTTGFDNVTTNNGNRTLQAFYGSGLFPQPDGEFVYGSGFYYMVVVSKTEPDTYAVAGTQSLVTITKNVVSGDDSAGIYATPVGSAPSAEHYVDPGWLDGNTWVSALAPEPTVMALLALGVAGMALRRKENFTK